AGPESESSGWSTVAGVDSTASPFCGSGAAPQATEPRASADDSSHVEGTRKKRPLETFLVFMPSHRSGRTPVAREKVRVGSFLGHPSEPQPCRGGNGLRTVADLEVE